MYSAIPDWLSMPTDRFLLILERLERRQKPHGEWCLVALSLCLACLFPLVTTETFKSTFGFKPEMWQAFSLLGMIVFGLGAIALSVRWVYLKFTRPNQTHGGEERSARALTRGPSMETTEAHRPVPRCA